MSNRKKTGLWLLLAMAIIVIIACLYYQSECGCEHQPYSNNENGWWCRLLSDPATVLTAFGVLVGVFGFWFISRQIEQSGEELAEAKAANTIALEGIEKASRDFERGLVETKRSVDAYVEYERGMIKLVDGFLLMRGITNGNRHMEIYFTAQNVGRGMCTIAQIATFYDVIELRRILGEMSMEIINDVPVFNGIYETKRDMQHFLLPNKTFTVGNYTESNPPAERIASTKGMIFRIPYSVANKVRDSVYLRVRFRIIYYTPIGEYEMNDEIIFIGDDNIIFPTNGFRDRFLGARPV